MFLIMKKANFLLVVLSVVFVFSSCEKESYIKKIYYIENALDSKIYVAYDYPHNGYALPIVKIGPNDYDAFHSNYIIDGDESGATLDNLAFEFDIEYKNKHYTVTKENLDGPSWSKNYHRDINLDYEASNANIHYTTESYVFAITDEFMASLTPDEE